MPISDSQTGVSTQTGLKAHAERIPTAVYDHASEASQAVAHQIADLIQRRARENAYAVLGLATGSTPTGVYAELVRLHREEGLSLANAITFNLDEYFPMPAHALQSYRRFMREHLFDHVDIPEEQIHIPDGTLSFEEVGPYCEAYEKAIQDAGGLDLQLLGIGRTGHVGFNEPGSSPESRTRLIWLDQLTRLDAASDFFGLEFVPYRAITMGVGTILDARQIVLMAFGENKASIIQQAVEGPVTETVAASYLQQHNDAQIVVDRPASAELTRMKCPWLIGPMDWTDERIRAAVIWLARRVNKAVLKLTDEDYNAHGLQGLVADQGPAYEINLRVFRQLQRTITGWPGGKPASAKQPGDVDRQRDSIFPKRILIFSPHPDDDVISMGGTLIRLTEQGHDVHVAYQVSGSIAVSDADTLRHADFVENFNHQFEIDPQRAAEFEAHIERFLKNKQPGEVDSDDVLRLKALIRHSEARAAGRYCGLSNDQLHFLAMPFYETGTVRKKPLGEADVSVIRELLETIQPHQVYAAGDLSDPHGTHRTCLCALARALQGVSDQAWYRDCELWLYRGAWQEWAPEDMSMAVPLSPDEVGRKRTAIFKHESQKDRALFPGPDPREFWQRAEDRNAATAELYDALGLAEYAAIEGFARWTPANLDAAAQTM
jgi:glucosamine-6-phosphate deaminase